MPVRAIPTVTMLTPATVRRHVCPASASPVRRRRAKMATLVAQPVVPPRMTTIARIAGSTKIRAISTRTAVPSIARTVVAKAIRLH